MRLKRALIGALVLACCVPALGADDEEGERRLGWKAGADIFFGLSNLGGPVKRITDRQWAAVETSEPSCVHLDWAGAAGDDVRLSLGVGDAYTGRDRTTKQPVECWWRRPVGSGAITFGKHYVPFAQQEWEYETRWGAMAEADLAGAALSLSATHNPDTSALNATIRVAREMAEGFEVGLSVGAGRGWCYSTSHSSGYALDAVAELGPVTLTTEALIADGPNGRYTFAFGKAMTEARPGWRPYLGAYYGHDTADEMGELRSAVIGMEIDAGPNLMLDPGYGRASGRHVWWLSAKLSF
ncbi:MAG: hypothetical protein FJX72_13860 [Armatimonadetes bacterium]|nr:hypothetical protein [Armatimonadota bacterium]